MNIVYKLVWNASQQAWCVAGEFSKSIKKSPKSLLRTFAIGTTLGLCAFSSFAEMSGTQEKILNNEEFILTQPFNPDDGDVRGKDAWHISGIIDGGDLSNNKAFIGQRTIIHGGNGVEGGAGIRARNISITNDNIIHGGNSDDLNDGIGGDGVTGYNLSIINNNFIGGGWGKTGGSGIAGNKLRIENAGAISGGDGGNSGGTGIKGVNMRIINSGSIAGGIVNVGKGGTAIYSMNSSIVNSGSIDGGSGSEQGGTAILSGSAADVFSTSIENSGRIVGGYGECMGGTAISTVPNAQGTISIANSGEITGGYGWDWGGDAISGRNMTFINSGKVTGGYGKRLGGVGIWGNNVNIINDGVIAGGPGESGGDSLGSAVYVTGGTNYLTLNSGSVLYGAVNKDADAFFKVIVNDGATFNMVGNHSIVTTISNRGTVLINDLGADRLRQPVMFLGDMHLERTGHIVINNNKSFAGQTWIQRGNWFGDGGTVHLGTVLGGDNSWTDHLEITGHASGTTYVAVTNINGVGATTKEGIKLISTGSSDKDAFVQKGRIVGGMYEYHLQQGSATGKDMNSWYLTGDFWAGSILPVFSAAYPAEPVHSNYMWRPEIGSYAANLMAANTMFSNTLNDRHGSVLVDPVTGERHETTMWARAVGGHNEHHLGGGQLNTTANRMVYQMGGEMLTTSFTGDDALHLGVMGAYGHQNSKTHNKYTGYSSRGTVSGYAAGLYGTWFRDEASRTGLYADTWVQYGWFDNTVKGDELADEKYHSKGFMTSLETGYIYPAFSWISGGGMDNTLYLRPQAQLSWSDVKAKDHVEHNGTVVKPAGANHVQTKLGLRVSMTGQSHLDKGSVRKFEPFAEVNWVWNSSQYGVTMNDETSRQQGSRNVAELKTGVEGRITENLGVWGNVSQQLGGHSYSDTQGMVGLKYTF